MAEAAEQLEKTYTREEYLALEAQSDIKHEFFQGEIFAMSGGTYNHSKIAVNITITLGVKLRGKQCSPMNSDMRVHTPSGLDTYPDVSVFCSKPDLQDKQHTLLNPVVIIEVLSPSTRCYDRGDKFTLYRAIPTLTEYLLVDSEQMLVEHYSRNADNAWIFREYRDLTDSVNLAGIEETLSLAEIYETIAL
jgi:Uma2 family endonuclease